MFTLRGKWRENTLDGLVNFMKEGTDFGRLSGSVGHNHPPLDDLKYNYHLIVKIISLKFGERWKKRSTRSFL